MSVAHAQFVGSIPEKYEENLGPLLFHFYAEDLASRVAVGQNGRVLETACGTGISTEFLRRALPDSVKIVATDLNEPMLEVARAKRRELNNVVFEEANALALPYDDASFDVLLCQFGLMFFPDKLAGLREAARVLKPKGQLLFNVWDSLDWNPIAQIAFETIATFFDEDPPTFMKTPFGCHDIDPIKGMLHDVGFADVQINVIRTVSETPSARHAAEGLVTGNPNIVEIQDRASAPLEEVIGAVTDAVRKEFGDDPMRAPMQAIVFSTFR